MTTAKGEDYILFCFKPSSFKLNIITLLGIASDLNQISIQSHKPWAGLCMADTEPEHF